jgi:hypothetical protein
MLGVITLLAAFVSVTPTPATPVATDEILLLERRFADSLVRRDHVLHDALLADDLVHIGFEGQIAAKPEYMAFFRQGDWRYTRYSTSSVAVKRLGSTAVVTGRADRAIFVNGRETVGAFVFTHVWTRSGEVWRLTSSQLTNVPPPRAALSGPA